MASAIRITFDFERVAVAIGSREVDAYGEAVIVGDRRTWRIDAIAAEIDGVRMPWIKPGTTLFERLRIGLHRQCGEQIAARLNRAVEDQGGYALLFGEDMPVDPIERGRRQEPAFDAVFDLVA